LGTIQEGVQETEGSEVLPGASMRTNRPRQSLPPKGSCWYCEKTLDSVRRFCGKECADAFDEEQEYTPETAHPPVP
jgi:hypothetical protein